MKTTPIIRLWIVIYKEYNAIQCVTDNCELWLKKNNEYRNLVGEPEENEDCFEFRPMEVTLFNNQINLIK